MKVGRILIPVGEGVYVGDIIVGCTAEGTGVFIGITTICVGRTGTVGIAVGTAVGPPAHIGLIVASLFPIIHP